MNIFRMNDLNVVLTRGRAIAPRLPAFVAKLPVVFRFVSITLRLRPKSFLMIFASRLLAFELPEVLGIHVLPFMELALNIAM